MVFDEDLYIIEKLESVAVRPGFKAAHNGLIWEMSGRQYFERS
jgi:hypothetical protein